MGSKIREGQNSKVLAYGSPTSNPAVAGQGYREITSVKHHIAAGERGGFVIAKKRGGWHWWPGMERAGAEAVFVSIVVRTDTCVRDWNKSPTTAKMSKHLFVRENKSYEPRFVRVKTSVNSISGIFERIGRSAPFRSKNRLIHPLISDLICPSLKRFLIQFQQIVQTFRSSLYFFNCHIGCLQLNSVNLITRLFYAHDNQGRNIINAAST